MGNQANIDAGALRHQVTLIRDVASATPNSVGEFPLVPTQVGTYYSLVQCLGGAESVNGKQLKGTLRYKVTFRASAGPIFPSDSITWNGHTMNVVAAMPDPFGILIEVDAVEKGSQ